jgi:hypothetical protein
MKGEVKKLDKDNMVKHIKEHIEYPSAKAELVKACNNMSDIAEDDRAWFSKNLPDGTYNSADEVMNALGL